MGTYLIQRASQIPILWSDKHCLDCKSAGGEGRGGQASIGQSALWLQFPFTVHSTNQLCGYQCLSPNQAQSPSHSSICPSHRVHLNAIEMAHTIKNVRPDQKENKMGEAQIGDGEG